MIMIEHSIASCSKTRYIPSYQGWMRQPIQEKRSQEQTKESETPSLSLLGVHQDPQAKQPQHVSRGSRTDQCRLYICSFSLCDCLWAQHNWLCRSFSCGVFDPWISCNSSFHSPVEFPELGLMFGFEFLHQFPSTARGSLFDDESMSTAESHY